MVGAATWFKRLWRTVDVGLVDKDTKTIKWLSLHDFSLNSLFDRVLESYAESKRNQSLNERRIFESADRNEGQYF